MEMKAMKTLQDLSWKDQIGKTCLGSGIKFTSKFSSASPPRCFHGSNFSFCGDILSSIWYGSEM
ncbi:unnamed protein product [Arabidopsis halleri]